MGFRQHVGQTVRGIPITVEGLKAGLHLGGPGGVQAFFNGKDSADANGTKVASYIRMGADAKDAPTRYAGLSYDKIERALNDGINERARTDVAATAATQAQVRQQVDALMLAIDRGQAGQTEIASARQQGWLDDAMTLRAENALDAINRKTDDLRAAQGKISTDDYQWNQMNKDDRKSVNALSEAYKGEERAKFDLALWQRTAIMPDNLVAELNGAIISNDPKKMEKGVQILSNIVAGSSSQNPFAGVNNSTDLYNTAYEAVRLMDDLGMTSAQAAQELAKRNDPEYRAKAYKGDKEVVEFKKQLTDDAVTSRILSDFATRTLGIKTGGASSLGLGDQQQKHIVSIFTELATKNYAQFGNKDQAMNYASKTMQQMFSVDPAGRLVQYGPDKAQGYPEINGSRTWVYEQAAEAATAYAGKKVEAKDVILTPLPVLTRETFTTGKPVVYGITYLTTDDNGMPKVDVVLWPGSMERRAFFGDATKVQQVKQPGLVDRFMGVGRGIGDSIREGAGLPKERYITGGQF